MISKAKLYKDIFIGFVTALIATLFGCFIFVYFLSKYDFDKSLAFIVEGNLESKVLSLGAVANFFVFYIFLKKKQLYRARGVLLESILIALLVTFLTFF